MNDKIRQEAMHLHNWCEGQYDCAHCDFGRDNRTCKISGIPQTWDSDFGLDPSAGTGKKVVDRIIERYHREDGDGKDEDKMTELIDKYEAMRQLKAAYDGSVEVHGDNDNLFADGIDYAMDIIGNMKVADVAPVIRCKDCKWYERNKQKGGFCRKSGAAMWSPGLPYDELKSDDYCSRAKRKEDEQ